MAAKPIQTVDPEEKKAKRGCLGIGRKKERPKPRNWLHGLWLNWIKPIGLAVLVVFAFRWTFFDWNDVPSASMEPTILVGDRIFVNKLAYHLKFPFTHWKIATWDEPEKGEIVVFFGEQGLRGVGERAFSVVRIDRENAAYTVSGDVADELETGDLVRVYQNDGTGDAHTIASIERDGENTRIGIKGEIMYHLQDATLVKAERKRMIKRVVATAGDVIELRDEKTLIINGEEHIAEENGAEYGLLDLHPPPNRTKFPIEGASYGKETLGGVEHPVMYVTDHRSSYTDFGPVTVPEGHFFVMGDNRNNSRDSRDPRLGFIPMDDLVGRSFGVAFSFDKVPGIRPRWERWLRGFAQEKTE